MKVFGQLDVVLIHFMNKQQQTIWRTAQQHLITFFTEFNAMYILFFADILKMCLFLGNFYVLEISDKKI